jgi:hypothetical protein
MVSGDNKFQLTTEQQVAICWIIDEWYIKCQSRITEPVILLRLALAKEYLKEMICGDD